MLDLVPHRALFSSLFCNYPFQCPTVSKSDSLPNIVSISKPHGGGTPLFRKTNTRDHPEPLMRAPVLVPPSFGREIAMVIDLDCPKDCPLKTGCQGFEITRRLLPPRLLPLRRNASRAFLIRRPARSSPVGVERRPPGNFSVRVPMIHQRFCAAVCSQKGLLTFVAFPTISPTRYKLYWPCKVF